jgi:hypothetical protein
MTVPRLTANMKSGRSAIGCLGFPRTSLFPFSATREEDEDDAYFKEGADRAPFRLGHTMEILGLEMEDDLHGVIGKAKEKGRIGHVPLCDLEVKPKTDKNFWPVREYVVWFANR